MRLHTISMPERDKLAAGYGSVSDVFDYYPSGITFPVFVDEKMEKVSVVPDGEDYIVYSGKSRDAANGIRGSKHSLFSVVVDHARDILQAKDIALESTYSFPIPQIA